MANRVERDWSSFIGRSDCKQQRAAVREEVILLLLAGPALAITAVLLLVPLIWLLFLSFYDGEPTLRHYERIVSDPAYAQSFILTFRVAGTITVLAIAIGYPIAYFIVRLPRRLRQVMLALVLIPFWTSMLVRTYAWLVILQRRGVVNTALVDAGLIGEPLSLVHNVTGTVIGTLHVLLPFMIIPLIANMSRIDRNLVRAAMVLGASPLRAFWMIFLPLSLPGLVAGSVLVFVLSIGYYITPALLGGGGTVMIGMLIERNVNIYFEWGAASAVAIVLLLIVMFLLWLAQRMLPLDQLLVRH